MSNRTRKQPKNYRLDYSIWSKIGEKVYKTREDISEMDSTKQLQLREMQCKGDIDDHLELYKVEELTDINEVEEALSFIGELGKEFRHVHIE